MEIVFYLQVSKPTLTSSYLYATYGHPQHLVPYNPCSRTCTIK